MSKADLLRIQGVVKRVLGPGILEVDIGTGTIIHCKICGRMLLHKVAVGMNDKVLIGVSPYDLARGLVIWKQ